MRVTIFFLGGFLHHVRKRICEMEARKSLKQDVALELMCDINFASHSNAQNGHRLLNLSLTIFRVKGDFRFFNINSVEAKEKNIRRTLTAFGFSWCCLKKCEAMAIFCPLWCCLVLFFLVFSCMHVRVICVGCRLAQRPPIMLWVDCSVGRLFSLYGLILSEPLCYVEGTSMMRALLGYSSLVKGVTFHCTVHSYPTP